MVCDNLIGYSLLLESSILNCQLLLRLEFAKAVEGHLGGGDLLGGLGRLLVLI